MKAKMTNFFFSFLANTIVHRKTRFSRDGKKDLVRQWFALVIPKSDIIGWIINVLNVYRSSSSYRLTPALIVRALQSYALELRSLELFSMVKGSNEI